MSNWIAAEIQKIKEWFEGSKERLTALEDRIKVLEEKVK